MKTRRQLDFRAAYRFYSFNNLFFFIVYKYYFKLAGQSKIHCVFN